MNRELSGSFDRSGKLERRTCQDTVYKLTALFGARENDS
jgi:hypothetical protein